MGQMTVLVMCFLVLMNISFADVNVAQLAHDYYQFKKSKLTPPDPCIPRTSCFKVACDFFDRFECDDINEQENIRNACKGVWGGECINVATQFLGRLEYDDNEEMVQLVASCRGVYDLECVKYSCGRLGRLGCDELEEVVRVNNGCASAHPYYN